MKWKWKGEHSSIDTFIGADTVVEGVVKSDCGMTIEGRIQGRVEAKGEVVVAREGRIEADVWANSVVVAGEITGNVNAGSRVEITATGRVIGDIASPAVTISEGARVDGSLKMKQQVGGKQAEAERLIPLSSKG